MLWEADSYYRTIVVEASCFGDDFIEINVCGCTIKSIIGMRNEDFDKAQCFDLNWEMNRDLSQSLVTNWHQSLPGRWCLVGSKSVANVRIWKFWFYVYVAYQNTVCMCCVRWVRKCCDEARVALRWPFLFSLCFLVLSLPPSRHCVLHQPPSIPQSFEKVGALFSLLLLLLCFRKRHLLKQQEPKKRGGKRVA